jgi:hypothetical protein
MNIPQPRRASLSGYVQPGKLLPWAWVDHRMTHAKNYWITTVSPGFPSSRPVWGIWRSPTLLFSTGSAIARHIERDERVQMNLESADEVVIIEGRAAPLSDQGTATLWAEAYREKYNWDMPAEVDGVFVINPTRVLAWLCDSSGLDAGAGFSNSATQWDFS